MSIYRTERGFSGRPREECLWPAEIPLSKLGAARASRLTPPERELYLAER